MRPIVGAPWSLGLGVVAGCIWAEWPGPAFAATVGLGLMLCALWRSWRAQRR